MSKSMNTRILLILLSVFTGGGGCTNYRLEKRFFDQPAKDRVERLRQCSLKDQYKIFRYGNDVIHPPVMALANPIAERGAGAIPFLLSELERNHDDMTTRDMVLIFVTMASSRSYDVKSDLALMTLLSSRVEAIKDKEWQVICLRMLNRMKDE
jgi:hypothetical protein